MLNNEIYEYKYNILYKKQDWYIGIIRKLAKFAYDCPRLDHYQYMYKIFW